MFSNHIEMIFMERGIWVSKLNAVNEQSSFDINIDEQFLFWKTISEFIL